MNRRTYEERRAYSARVMRFRQGIYGRREGLTAGCRVLLLRLSDDMDAQCKVSIPRSQLAVEFGVAPARITEWVAQAKSLGFLDVVRRARPGVTAVYQGLRPATEVREDVPLEDESEVRETGPLEVRQDVPQSEVQRYARAVPQEVVAPAGIEQAAFEDGSDDGSKEKAGPEDHSPLAALEAFATYCPHGMPGGSIPDPWDEANPRDPACPECRATSSKSSNERRAS